ncbi:MAG: hypothetical protein U9R06_04070 [Patescibacteria group bacterium]|nr:hypothetical protein [Patescibacteria group bacterium]
MSETENQGRGWRVLVDGIALPGLTEAEAKKKMKEFKNKPMKPKLIPPLKKKKN